MREWEVAAGPGPLPNDRESRARRYGLYLEQMRCLYRKLYAMFQAWQKVFDRATIVIHSDHGSRIYQHHLNAYSQPELSEADYIDSFSTLFAVKGSRHPPGYDRRVAPLERLLGEVVGVPAKDAHSDPKPYVCL